jgi:hypothetical protein
MADKPSRGLAHVVAASTASRGTGGHVTGQQVGGPLPRRGSGHAGERGLTRTPLGRR